MTAATDLNICIDTAWKLLYWSYTQLPGKQYFIYKLHGYTVHQTMLKPFHYQLMHIMLKNTELLKHSKITLQHVSVYAETIFRELQSVLG